MTPRERALEILYTLKARPFMYCTTKEAALCRVTTVLDMLGVDYSPSTFYQEKGENLDLSLTSEWVGRVVDAALEIISAGSF